MCSKWTVCVYTHVSIISISGGQTVCHGFWAQSAGVISCRESKRVRVWETWRNTKRSKTNKWRKDRQWETERHIVIKNQILKENERDRRIRNEKVWEKNTNEILIFDKLLTGVQLVFTGNTYTTHRMSRIHMERPEFFLQDDHTRLITLTRILRRTGFKRKCFTELAAVLCSH